MTTSKVLDQTITDRWALYHGDTVDVMRGMPDDKIHYSVYSPPFASLFSYSASPHDMGNVKSHAEFYEQYRFAVAELYRITKPGRLLSFHCMLLPTSKSRDGFIGLTDFRGELIRIHTECGWIHHSEVVIWKDPVTAMQRTKALGLLHKQIRKDSTMSRQGIPDYLITMRKPGDNDEPVSHTAEGDDMPVSMWQRYASPVWVTTGDTDNEGFAICSQDIDPSDTLQYRSAREHEDERHICLASGSLVLTREHGYLEIEDVEVGDRVLTHRGRWMPVLAKRCNGLADTVRVCAQGVADLTATPDHKVWARVGGGTHVKSAAQKSEPEWITADSSLGSYLNLPTPPEEPNALTPDEWWIVGRWIGDGHRGGHRRSGTRGGLGQFIISCNHNEAEALIARLGDHAGHVARITATQIALVYLRDEVREVLSRCGEGASNKRIPGEAVTLDAVKSEALLSGYLSADGHYVAKHDRLVASSVSRALLLGMAIVAQRARGVVASVYAGRPDREGFIEDRPVHMLQDWIFSFRNSDGFAKSGWIDDGGAWKKVRKIESTGEREVWDLQVAEDSSFVAEGAVVHNCPLQLEVIRRAVRLWTNPGDTVFSPFAGIGSELHTAVTMGRKAIGAELKKSYYEQACRNMATATEVKPQTDMFSMLGVTAVAQ